MTRPLADVERVFELADAGRSKRAISMATGVSRASIREWLADRERAIARGANKSANSSKSCAGACEPWIGLDEYTYSYLLGMYLGDGCISELPRSYRLRVACTAVYTEIIDEVDTAIQKIVAAKVCRVQREGCVEVSAYGIHWPCFFPQHGPGRKHERPIILESWQREIVARYPEPFIRGLIQSDGWRGDNVAIRTTAKGIERRTYPRYQFTNHSEDIRGLFCWALDLIGVHWTQSNKWTISVAKRKDVHYLDSFVGPKR